MDDEHTDARPDPAKRLGEAEDADVTVEVDRIAVDGVLRLGQATRRVRCGVTACGAVVGVRGAVVGVRDAVVVHGVSSGRTVAQDTHAGLLPDGPHPVSR